MAIKTKAQMVKEDIDYIMRPHQGIPIEIPFQGVVIHRSYDKATTIEFHGTTHMNAGYAIYQGPLGKWLIKLASRTGGVENAQEKPCTRTSGVAVEIA